MESLGLFQLLQTLREELEESFPDEYWVRAEISELKGNASGHRYLELVEKDKDGEALLARTKAVIWAGTWRGLSADFLLQTGSPLSVGQQVLVCVQVNFHPLYGLSLVINDIDPSYTLGDWARRRQDILQRLKAEGVIDLNKELPFPALPQRIAVISSPQAAGYEDFMKHLSASPYAFYTCLFPAMVQGDQAEPSILAALDRIVKRIEAFDVVVLIRGGGSSTDLSCFDSYPLASALAQFPLPVVSGIGHERDKSVVDEVACVALKTPTATADYLISCLDARWNELVSAAEELRRRSLTCLQQQHYLLDTFHLKFCHAWENLLQTQRHRLDLWERDVEARSPREQLKKGFSITTCRGKLIRKVTEVKPGDELETRLYDGTIVSMVK